jgi:hypothetical protein
MTLPASGTISLSDVLAEIRLATPARSATISLGDADVLALAGKSAAPISLSDLYGKSSYVPMTVTGVSDFASNIPTATPGTASVSPSVTVRDGSGGYTYAWAYMAGYGASSTLSNSNSPACNVTKAFARNENGSFDEFLQCTVTDNTGHVVTVSNIEAYAQWGIAA